MHSPSLCPRHRIRWLLVGFVVLCAGIGGRLVALELRYGAAYRAEASRPTQQRRVLPAARGRILASDGTVLACDEPLASLAVQYRWLQDPPDPNWLRRLARSRLSAAERRQRDRVAAEEAQLLAARDDLHRRLAELCQLTPAEWHARCARIQSHVQTLVAGANRRAAADGRPAESAPPADESWWSGAGRKLWNGLVQGEPPPALPIVVAEELCDHVVFAGLSLEAVAEIEGHPLRYPGVRIARDSRRAYPAGPLAAHVLGFVGGSVARRVAGAGPQGSPGSVGREEVLGASPPRTGRSGVERQYDALLNGTDGQALDVLDRHGLAVETHVERPAVPGRDLVLTIDPVIERAAEAVLDAALARRLPPLEASFSGEGSRHLSGGGALIVMNVHTGAILAITSAPRFDPGSLSDPQAAAAAWEHYRSDAERPLFDRAVQMALPPGSVFKTLTAAALLESPGFDPRQSFECQGYLHSPDSQRCAIYRRWGVGHGPVTLTDALARSCNVYFFHWAEQFGPGPIVDWAKRFGFATPTGIDLPGESAGHLPGWDGSATSKLNATLHPSSLILHPSPDATALAIGQGALTVTPLQIVRMMAAVANGGQLVTPHVAARVSMTAADEEKLPLPPEDGIEHAPPRPIRGLDSARLAILREGLRRVVTDPEGTGYAALHTLGVELAGKTGTAETGGGVAEHAWFAGYAPAEAPRLAFVVVLEHAGDASATAAPAAAHLVEKLQSLGYLKPRSER